MRGEGLACVICTRPNGGHYKVLMTMEAIGKIIRSRPAMQMSKVLQNINKKPFSSQRKKEIICVMNLILLRQF